MRELVAFAVILVGWAIAEASASKIDRPGPRTLAAATAACLLGGHVAGVVEHVVRGSPGFLVAGAIVATAGVALRVWAIVTLGARFASRLGSDALVTTGPYRWLRHPSELGLVLAMLGCALVLGSWATLASVVVALPFAWTRCARENAALAPMRARCSRAPAPS